MLAGLSFAQDAETITQDMLKHTIDRSTSILSDEETTVEQKQDAFDVLLLEVCQSDLMTKLALGRAGWVELSEEQRKEFISVFIQVLTRSYYNKMEMADISSVNISYTGNEKLSANKRKLTTVIADDVSSYRVEYMFANYGGRWGIYDMSIDGISLLTSYRSQFADNLKNHSAIELLEELRQKVAEL
jgi:phospholipid transport system substrate-binding protein